MRPIGVGFLGAGNDPDGLFHYQRLQFRSELRCTASRWDAHSFVKRESEFSPSQSTVEILLDPEISLVWTAADSSLTGAKAILEAGKHVLLGVPSEVTSESWRQLMAADCGAASKLFVAALHRWDGQFQTVRSQIKNGDLGSITELRRISRQFVPGELCVVKDTAGSAVDLPSLHDRESRAFQIQWFEMLDELLLLAPNPAKSVWARPTKSGRSVWVTFADGCQANLELDRRSLAPLETGWILEGTTGGYAAGRRFQAAGDFELVDVPVEQLPTDQDAFYTAIVATIRDGKPFPVTPASILRVITLREAIEKSLSTGLEVQIP